MENDMKNRIENVERIYNLCDEYLDFVNGYGNECAFTDSIICKIKEVAENIVEFGEVDYE